MLLLRVGLLEEAVLLMKFVVELLPNLFVALLVLVHVEVDVSVLARGHRGVREWLGIWLGRGKRNDAKE